MKRALSRKNLWEKFPDSVKERFGRVLGVVPSRYWLGSRFRANRRFVDSAQWWSAEQSRAYQLTQLRRICRLAYEKTAYYRRVFDSVGFRPGDLTGPEDLSHLPTIDKDTVRDHLAEMCATSPYACGVDYVSTGGTGGVPLHFYFNADRSPVEYAYLTGSWRRCGYTVGRPMAVFRGRVVPENRDGLRHAYDPILRHHYYSNFHMTDENMRRYLDHVATIGPCFLHVYPSSAFALARFCHRSGMTPPRNIVGIIAESEIVYPEQRVMVEEVFSCRFFSCYGHTEKLVLAAECEHSTDYHVWPTYGFFELLDEQGRPVTAPGQQGEIVGTGFINTVVPFIRYRTGDYATWAGDRCEACGRQHAIVRDIRGHRTQEMLIASDGSEISWTAMNMHDDTFLNVRQFQFYQDAPGRAVLRIVPGNGFDHHSRERIRQNLGRKLDGRLQADIQLVDSISLSPRGKVVYVDQRIVPVDTGTRTGPRGSPTG